MPRKLHNFRSHRLQPASVIKRTPEISIAKRKERAVQSAGAASALGSATGAAALKVAAAKRRVNSREKSILSLVGWALMRNLK